MTEQFDEFPKPPQNATWVERVARPDIGFKDRLKFTAKNILPASGGFVGNTLLGGDSKGWHK